MDDKTRVDCNIILSSMLYELDLKMFSAIDSHWNEALVFVFGKLNEIRNDFKDVQTWGELHDEWKRLNLVWDEESKRRATNSYVEHCHTVVMEELDRAAERCKQQNDGFETAAYVPVSTLSAPVREVCAMKVHEHGESFPAWQHPKDGKTVKIPEGMKEFSLQSLCAYLDAYDQDVHCWIGSETLRVIPGRCLFTAIENGAVGEFIAYSKCEFNNRSEGWDVVVRDDGCMYLEPAS